MNLIHLKKMTRFFYCVTIEGPLLRIIMLHTHVLNIKYICVKNGEQVKLPQGLELFFKINIT